MHSLPCRLCSYDCLCLYGFTFTTLVLLLLFKYYRYILLYMYVCPSVASWMLNLLDIFSSTRTCWYCMMPLVRLLTLWGTTWTRLSTSACWCRHSFRNGTSSRMKTRICSLFWSACHLWLRHCDPAFYHMRSQCSRGVCLWWNRHWHRAWWVQMKCSLLGIQ